MLLTCVVSAVLMTAASIIIIRAACRSIADSRLRNSWITISVAMVALTMIGLVVCVFLGQSAMAVLREVYPVLASSAIFSYAILMTGTIRYFSSINSVNGIKIVDPLTGAYNQIYLEQRLNNEIARSHRYGSPLSVVSMSVDSFPDLQEEYGHQAGGIAVKKVALKLNALLRETDIVATLGGGRFVLVLPDTPEGSVDGLITRLHSAIDGTEIINGTEKEQSVFVNVKFGKSHCGLQTNNGQELIDRAIHREAAPQPDLLRIAS